jgi:CDP-paratose synthetase
MKILVTGATGFIGQNLIKALLDNKHKVFIIVREDSNIMNIDKKVKFFRYSEKVDLLSSFFKKEQFDGVIHLASLFLASHKQNDISNLISSNIKFGTELLESSKNTNVKWFLNTGTFWQNFEDENYNPVNLYAATKEAFECIAKYYTQTSDLIFTTIKLNDTFGPSDTRNKVFNLWYRISQNGEILDMSEGEQTIDISYIDDIINAYMIMIDDLSKNDMSKYNNQTYVVSNKEKPTLNELSKIFEDATNSKLNINWGKREYRYREVMMPYTQGKSIPNWEQEFTLKEAIQKTIKDMKDE